MAMTSPVMAPREMYHRNMNTVDGGASLYAFQVSPTSVSPHERQYPVSFESRYAAHQINTQHQRSIISQLIHTIIKVNLPLTLHEKTTAAQLVLISRAIERKLYRVAPSIDAYADVSTLELRITAMATAVLIHTEQARQKQGQNTEQSETCTRLLMAARQSLVHCIMVLVSYEKRQLDEEFADMMEKELDGFLCSPVSPH